MKLNPEVQLLLAAMRDLERLLAGRNDFWAEQVRAAADEVARSDAHGLQRFLELFGGMGSLNDLVLHQDGKLLSGENDELDRLRERAWELAQAVRD